MWKSKSHSCLHIQKAKEGEKETRLQAFCKTVISDAWVLSFISNLRNLHVGYSAPTITGVHILYVVVNVLIVKVAKTWTKWEPSAPSVLPLSRAHHSKTEKRAFQFKKQKVLMEGSMSVSFKNHARGSTAGLLKENLNPLKKIGPIGERNKKTRKKPVWPWLCLAGSSSLQNETSILSAR